MFDFNDSKNDYHKSINDSISFIGADHDFFIATKGRILNEVLKSRFSGRLVSILDVGCGHGDVHPVLIEAGHRVAGVEIAEEVVELARTANPEADYYSYDGSSLPFADGSFDAVLAMCVLHHVPVPQWQAFINEARRVVRPGGVIAIFEHNPLNPLSCYVVANSELDVGATMVPRRRLEDMFRRSGVISVGSDYIFFTPFRGRLFRWLDRKLKWLPLGAQYLTLAEA